jgi:MATE family multidrug resistance protein
MASNLILYAIPLGLSVASSHRIGNLLGAGSANHAKLVARIPYILSLILGFIEFIVIMLAQNSFGYIFSDDEAVVGLVAQVLPLMAIFQFVDLSNSGACGVLRGAGKVYLAGVSNIAGYSVVGITSAWYLCFHLDQGLFGLWAGLLIGSVVLLGLQTFWIILIDWEKEVTFVLEQHRSYSI